jgi:hypothetical protein
MHAGTGRIRGQGRGGAYHGLLWQNRPFPTVQGLATTSESSRTYQLLTRCWQKLPLQISGPLGGYLYRHLG